MKKVIILNHPQQHPNDAVKIEHAVGNKCCVTNVKMDMGRICKKTIEQMSKDCDILVLFHSTMETIGHILQQCVSCKNIRILHGCTRIPGNYVLEEM